MSLNSLDSVRRYITTTESMIKSQSHQKLREPILTRENVELFAEKAFHCHSINAHAAKRMSSYASLSGFLSISSILGGLILNHTLTKGKNIQSRLLAIALIVSGILLMTFWLAFKNYPASLTKDAIQALKKEQDSNAFDLIVKGADPKYELCELTAKMGCYQSFLYLTLLRAHASSPYTKSELFKKNMMEALLITQNLHVAKVACDLGADINSIFNESNRCNKRQAQIVLALGADPTYIFQYAEDVEAARLAASKGADYKNADVMGALFNYASRERKKSLIAYLNELKI